MKRQPAQPHCYLPHMIAVCVCVGCWLCVTVAAAALVIFHFSFTTFELIWNCYMDFCWRCCKIHEFCFDNWKLIRNIFFSVYKERFEVNFMHCVSVNVWAYVQCFRMCANGCNCCWPSNRTHLNNAHKIQTHIHHYFSLARSLALHLLF